MLLDNFGFVGFLCVFCWAIAVCEYSFLLIFGLFALLGRGGLGVYCFGRRVRTVGYFTSLGVVMKEMHDAMKSDSSKWIVLLSAAFVLWRGSVFARALALGMERH